MRRRCTVSTFFVRGVACGERACPELFEGVEAGAGVAETSAAVATFLAWGFRTFVTFASAVIERERVCTGKGENANALFEKCQCENERAEPTYSNRIRSFVLHIFAYLSHGSINVLIIRAEFLA